VNLSILGEIASDRKIYAFQADAVAISAPKKPDEAPFRTKKMPGTASGTGTRFAQSCADIHRGNRLNINAG